MIKEYIKYLKDNPRGYWFKARLYGWGWTPATWQGWLVLAIWLVLVLFFAFKLEFIQKISNMVLAFSEKRPYLFYPIMFLIAYQLVDLFTESREIIGYIRHPLGK